MKEKYYFSDWKKLQELHESLDRLLDNSLAKDVGDKLKILFNKYNLDEFQYRIVEKHGVIELEPVRPIDRYILIAILYS